MCGIVGIRSLGDRPVETDELRRMADVIRHRGPDDFGHFIASEVGLAMRRLEIIDLETGRQPIHNEDETVWVVLNGEIYNFRQKRQELEARGHHFYTGTDTEVIVHLYEEYGADCVDHMRGMFAFAVWDARRRTLLLARDRIGIKPLYYGVFGGRLVFASEIKSFLTLPEVERELDWTAVRHLFTFLVTPPAQSILSGVRKLEPGHILIADHDDEPRVRRYWDLDFEPHEGRTEASVIEELRAVLREAVDLHMVSDVPIGAFLSGGVDSSSVVAMMSDLSDRPVKTFAIGFADERFNELDHARVVARHLGTDHREQTLAPDVFEILDDLAWYLDEPFGDSSAIPTFMVSRMAAEEVTVALSGDGGDELFAGYDKYRVEGRERRWDGLPRSAKQVAGLASKLIPEGRMGHRFLRHHGLSGVDRYLDAVSFFTAQQHQRLFTPEAWREMDGYDPWQAQRSSLLRRSDDWLSALQYADFHHYLPLDILTKVDRMSMAHSLEARVPLLDHVVVETSARIPSTMKLRDGKGKHVFKEAMKGILPATILERRKQGFAIPLDGWFRGRLDSFVRETLLSSTSLERGIFQASFLEKVIALNGRGRSFGSQLWTLISFELWCRQFLDEDLSSAHVLGDRRMTTRSELQRSAV